MDIKRLDRVEIKDATKGEFSAAIATYGVIDRDGDVTLPGAHKDGQRVVISAYNHSVMLKGQPPVGTGTLRVQRNRTVVDGRYFMDVPEAKSAFMAMKSLHEQGMDQWSYGFDVLDSEMGQQDGRRVRFLKSQDVFEASPVVRGAGIDTRTLSAKTLADGDLTPSDAQRWMIDAWNKATDNHDESKERPVEVDYKAAAIKSHHASITAQEWDPAGAVAGIPDGTSVSDLRTVFAWVDPNEDPELKASYRFPHHHGVDGPANIRALITGIAVLNGAVGAKSIPETHRQAVYDHLAGHLRDADREPPELRPPDGELKLHEEAIAALAGVGDYLESAERVVALRAEKGKALSRVNLEALGWAGEDLRRMVLKHAELERRLRDTPREAAAVEFARFLANQRRSAT